jgi:hypothetical protein
MNSFYERYSKYSCDDVLKNSQGYYLSPSLIWGGLNSWKCNLRKKVIRIDFPRNRD